MKSPGESLVDWEANVNFLTGEVAKLRLIGRPVRESMVRNDEPFHSNNVIPNIRFPITSLFIKWSAKMIFGLRRIGRSELHKIRLRWRMVRSLEETFEKLRRSQNNLSSRFRIPAQNFQLQFSEPEDLLVTRVASNCNLESSTPFNSLRRN